MQLSTLPAMRGRIMALRVGVALGGTPLGAPIVGYVADHFGPRWALGVGAAGGFAAAGVGLYALTHFLREGPGFPADGTPKTLEG
jgi:MFS family permease